MANQSTLKYPLYPLYHTHLVHLYDFTVDIHDLWTWTSLGPSMKVRNKTHWSHIFYLTSYPDKSVIDTSRKFWYVRRIQVLKAIILTVTIPIQPPIIPPRGSTPYFIWFGRFLIMDFGTSKIFNNNRFTTEFESVSGFTARNSFVIRLLLKKSEFEPVNEFTEKNRLWIRL